MKRAIVPLVGACLAVALVLMAVPAATQTGTYFSLPPPPKLDAAPAEPTLAPEDVPTPGTSNSSPILTLMAPPPPRNACVRPKDRNDALMGTGCSCGCEAYARKPVSDKCDLACGGYYLCWGPLVSDIELKERIGAEAYAAASPDDRKTMAYFLRVDRAIQWDEDRLCK
jgi:hypothetical protein